MITQYPCTLYCFYIRTLSLDGSFKLQPAIYVHQETQLERKPEPANLSDVIVFETHDQVFGWLMEHEVINISQREELSLKFTREKTFPVSITLTKHQFHKVQGRFPDPSELPY